MEKINFDSRMCQGTTSVVPQRQQNKRGALAPEVCFSDHPGISTFSQESIELRRYILHNPAGESAPFYLLPGLNVEISASQLRDWIRHQVRAVPGTPIAGIELLPSAVFDYIRSRDLYS